MFQVTITFLCEVEASALASTIVYSDCNESTHFKGRQNLL